MSTQWRAHQRKTLDSSSVLRICVGLVGFPGTSAHGCAAPGDLYLFDLEFLLIFSRKSSAV